MSDAQWLVFDLGGVLFDFRGVEGVAKLTGMSLESAHEVLVGSSAVHALETGVMGREEFGARLVDELGVGISPQEMLDLWANWETGPKPGAIELLTLLGDQRPIACLTNNNAIHWERLSSLYGADQLFQKCYLSHEIGLHKPDPRIFEHVITDLDTPAAQITYFDDRADIVHSAKACGLDAHQVTSPQGIRAVLGMS